MTEIRINQNLCRLCGCKNENGQSLSGDQDDEGANELLLKVQETFSLLVSLRISLMPACDGKHLKSVFRSFCLCACGFPF